MPEGQTGGRAAYAAGSGKRQVLPLCCCFKGRVRSALKNPNLLELRVRVVQRVQRRARGKYVTNPPDRSGAGVPRARTLHVHVQRACSVPVAKTVSA